MPAKRSTRTRTSSRSRTSAQARGSQNKNKKKPKKKQDNTKLFIGIGVGVFFLLFIIIALASGGGEQTNRASNSLSADFLTVSQRKEIYSKYNQEYNSLEKDASDKMAYLSMEDRRRQGRAISNSKNRLQAYLPEKMKNLQMVFSI